MSLLLARVGFLHTKNEVSDRLSLLAHIVGRRLLCALDGDMVSTLHFID